MYIYDEYDQRLIDERVKQYRGQTERYLAKILNRITLPGSLFLAAIALIPSALLFQLLGGGSNNLGLLGFSGISILIGVGVSLEIMKQINSQLMARNYEGFLK